MSFAPQEAALRFEPMCYFPHKVASTTGSRNLVSKALARISALFTAAVLLFLLGGPQGTSSAALEGVRDCNDVVSKRWNTYEETSTGVRVYEGRTWVVFAGVGLQPGCRFARRWADRAVREAVHHPKQIYRRSVTKANRPAGWRCTVSNSPPILNLSGGILQCLRYSGRKLVGSFSAAPDLDNKFLSP
jgi:hypothetical protein